MSDPARPPRPARRPVSRPIEPVVDAGVLELRDGTVGPAELDLDRLGVDRAEIVGAELSAVRITGSAEIVVRDSHLTDCDLSSCRLPVVLRSTLTRCKLVGAEAFDARWHDTALVECVLRLVDARRTSWSRLAITDGDLAELDLAGATLADLTVEGSRLDRVRWVGIDAARVDLRGAADLTLVAVDRLDGCVIDDLQLPAIAPSLAVALGLTVDVGENEPFEND